MLTRTLAAILILTVAGSLHAQRHSAGDFWRSIAEEDLRRYFAFLENCNEPAKIEIAIVESTTLQAGTVRSVERWSLTGCSRVRSYRVIFNPDSATGLSFKELP